MPCNSDYMEEPTGKERALQETAQLLVYVRINTKSGVAVTPSLRTAARNPYCSRDYVKELCGAISELSDDDFNRIMYDGRNPEARMLADWWDEHTLADREREAREQKMQMIADLKASAFRKLTQAEREAIGIENF